MPRRDVIAAKPVPPPATRPGPAHLRVSVDDLALVTAQGWVAVEQAGLGSWLLRRPPATQDGPTPCSSSASRGFPWTTPSTTASGGTPSVARRRCSRSTALSASPSPTIPWRTPSSSGATRSAAGLDWSRVLVMTGPLAGIPPRPTAHRTSSPTRRSPRSGSGRTARPYAGPRGHGGGPHRQRAAAVPLDPGGHERPDRRRGAARPPSRLGRRLRALGPPRPPAPGSRPEGHGSGGDDRAGEPHAGDLPAGVRGTTTARSPSTKGSASPSTTSTPTWSSPPPERRRPRSPARTAHSTKSWPSGIRACLSPSGTQGFALGSVQMISCSGM